MKEGGVTMMLNSEQMELLSQCNTKQIPLVIMLVQDGNLIDVMRGEDCNY